MKFRYFKLTGASLKAYADSESKEMGQRHNRADALLKGRDDIESFRPGRNGGIMSLIFKEGMQPEGMVRADRRLPKEEVRPSKANSKAGRLAKPFRDFLETVKVTEDCQVVVCKALNLPTFVTGSNTLSRTGMACYSSRVGHVGADVVIEVPVEEGERGKSDGFKPFEPHTDMDEMKAWEYVKACEEAEGHKHEDQCYCLEARMA